MIKSMTGYGRASFENDSVSIDVEVKSLNSKFLDIISKLPREVASYENDLKKQVSEKMVRGKVSFSIEIKSKSGVASAPVINKMLFDHYKSEIQAVADHTDLSEADIISQVLKFPDILQFPEEKTDLVEQSVLMSVVDQALSECDKFRCQEGDAAEKALQNAVKNISESLKGIELKDPERIENIKRRISDNLNELALSEKTDHNRFEQELIYYIEKLDINEEIVRLNNHLKYFQETLSNPISQGKKIGFISQEMGREINTIGSKANNADIQKLVVEMKDELEKIKEQVLNVV